MKIEKVENRIIGRKDERDGGRREGGRKDERKMMKN